MMSLTSFDSSILILILLQRVTNCYAFVFTTPRKWPTTRTVCLASRTGRNENVAIEYCTGCRWMLRSAWLAQELLNTFQDDLDAVSLIPMRPPHPGGIFRVTRHDMIVWDRKTEGAFPESKQLKQRIRDIIDPTKFLGHSDTTIRQEKAAGTDCDECPEAPAVPIEVVDKDTEKLPSPNVSIRYCTGCRWLLRAAWVAQELLTTFDSELNSVTLLPSRPPEAGGTFLVALNDRVIWDRSAMGGFPELKRLKQMIRAEIAPSRNLGHSDSNQSKERESIAIDEMDDDEAADMRKFFGVL